MTMLTMEKGAGVRENDLPWVDIAVRPGYKQRYHGFYDSSKHVGLRIGSLYADPHYMSPRHRHTFQQIRFLVDGKMRYNKEIYNAGDCLYIPEGTYYGPITPVEKREGGTEQMHFVDIQFEGPRAFLIRILMTSCARNASSPRPASSRKASIRLRTVASATRTRRSWRT
jgi:gentisate 1,2-dioxygenase